MRLKFSDDALEAIAELAMERKVGARGLRMILEDLMLDLMYYLPSYKKVREFQVTTRDGAVAEDQSYTIGKGRLGSGSRGFVVMTGRKGPGNGLSPGKEHAYFEGKIRYKTSADDAHPGRGHLSVHDDALRGGPRIQRPRSRRGHGRRQEDLPRHAARRLRRRTRTQRNLHASEPSSTSSRACKLPDGNIKVLVEGVERAKVVSVSDDEGFFRAIVRTSNFKVETGPQLDALISRVTGLFEQYVKLSQNLNYETMIAAIRVDDPGKLADTVGANLQLTIEEKQELLEIFDPIDRLTRVAEMLDIEIEKLNVDRTIQGRVKRQMEKAQKEYYLNEKIKAIQKELGRGEKSEIDELKKRIETAGMTQGRARKGHGGVEAAGKHAAHVGRIHRLAQLSRLAAGGAVEEEIQGNPRSAASPRRCSKPITTASKRSRSASSNSSPCAAW